MEIIDQVIKNTLNISDELMSKDLTMADVDNWDSLSHMNLIVAIESEFNIELSGDDIAEMTSFKAIRTILDKYIS